MACDLSSQTWQYVTLLIDAVEVRFVYTRLDAAKKPLDMINHFGVVSVPSVTAPINLSKFEVGSTFIIARLFWIQWKFRSGLTCLNDSGATLPDWRLASDEGCRNSFWNEALLYLDQLVPMYCHILRFNTQIKVPVSR